MIKKTLFALIIIASMLLTACGSGTPASVKIAVSVPMELEYGQDALHAAQLALEKAGGKAGNVKVEILVLSETEAGDETVSTPLVIKNAEQAVNDSSVVAWLGPDSSRTAMEIIPILNRASLTIISSTNTWPGLTKPGYGPGEPGIYYPTGRRNYFRTVSTDEVQGAAAARWAKELGYKTIFVVQGNDVYGQGIAGVFENTAHDIGLTILGKETFETETEVTIEGEAPLATKVMNAKPDLIFLAGSVGSNVEKIAVALRQAGPNVPIMGPDGLAVEDFITFLGADLANNIYSTTASVPPENLGISAATDFVREYEAKFGKKPSSYDAAMYEAMGSILFAISKTEKPTRENVLKATQNLGDYTGIFGTWHFDIQGDISLTNISGLQVQNGSWVFISALK